MVYKNLTMAILATGLAVAGFTALAADKPAVMSGASDSQLAVTCAGCHGTNGVSAGPAMPTIAGLSEEYFVEVMQGYASGEVPSTIMGRIAGGYTEGETKQMASFYSKQKFKPAKQSFDKAQVKTGAKLHDKYCDKCHGDGGSSTEDDSGVLAGQLAPYLRMQMADYYAGTRKPSKNMKKKMTKLHKKAGDAGLEAIINYYASQQ